MITSVVRCAGCGAEPPPDEPYEWVCPNRRAEDDVDHVMARTLVTGGDTFVPAPSEQPFVRYRRLLRSYHRWIAGGLADDGYVEMVERLDAAVARVDGAGFRRTPFGRATDLDRAVGGRVWVKDETHNVSGSHKGRHLFGVLLHLAVVEQLTPHTQPGPALAIASCGNAALAAAVLAAAAGRPLDVFIPPDAESSVVARLRDLGARIEVCERDGRAGDPCYRRFVAAVEGGAIPFGCQGPDNGMAIEGGETLAWELAEGFGPAEITTARMVVQVGGGALGAALVNGFADAAAVGLTDVRPRFDAVQTEGAAPFARAHATLVATGASPEYAAVHRSEFMWPWETEPRSVAHGILDDETYDWLALARGVVTTGGGVEVVDDALLTEANDLARRATGIDVDPTGSAGLAGGLAQARAGRLEPGENVIVVFTGVRREPAH